jgi:2-haloacid dehalogenase
MTDPVPAQPPTDDLDRPVTCVVFDLGGVLVEWDPRHLYRRLLASEEEVESFLAEISFDAWNHRMDAGERTWTEAVAELSGQFPHHRELISAYPERFAETLAGPVSGSVEIVRELHDRGTRLIALTNWSAETFAVARDEMPFLELFEAVLVSGQERVAKPDPAIFDLLLARFDLDPRATLFVDDREVNVQAAAAAGMRTHQFNDPAALREELSRLRLLSGRSDR